MPQNPDIQYIRVRHLGVTDGSLHLDDLDTEANKKQPHQIPVYIPEGGSVDLPLNDQVLLSFNQGTLRSFINQGLASGFVIKDDGSAEVWVSPNGDDSNPGTRSAPFASIQYAIDTLVERVGHNAYKQVNILPGEYDFFIVYTKNIKIKAVVQTFGGSDADEDITINPHKQLAYFITNGTKEEALLYLADLNETGGIFSINSSTADPNEVIEYVGGTTTNRQLAYEPKSMGSWGNVEIEGLAVVWNVIVVSMSDSETPIRLRNVTFREASGPMQLKDVAGALFSLSTRLVQSVTAEGGGGFAFNNMKFRAAPPLLFFMAIKRGITSLPYGIQGSVDFQVSDFISFHDLPMMHHSEIKTGIVERRGSLNKTIRLSGSHSSVQLNVDQAVSYPQIKVGRIWLEDSHGLAVDFLICKTIDHESDDILMVQTLDVREHVNITGGGTFMANGGTIKGNLTVNTPATATLNNVIVEGNITGTGTVTQNGGGYLGDNDVSTYTHNALKTT